MTHRTVQTIIEAHFGIEPGHLCDDTTRSDVAFPRQVSMYFVHKLYGYSLGMVARLHGRTNHATVSCAIRKVDIEMHNSPLLRLEIAALEAEIMRQSKEISRVEVERGEMPRPARSALGPHVPSARDSL